MRHISIAVLDIGFVRSAIDLPHLIGSKLQHPGRQVNEQQAATNPKSETGLTRRGGFYHGAIFTLLSIGYEMTSTPAPE